MNSNNSSGWFFLDKPIGMTSNFALQKIRRIFNNSKAGFVGTLDPLASGFLPIALGKATKIIPFIEKCDKRYIFTVKWGIKTETGDSEGKVIKESDKYPDKFDILKALKKFNGNIEQFPHKYSSVKINGQRAYKLARKNTEFQLKRRKIKFNNLTLTNNISIGKLEILSIPLSDYLYGPLSIVRSSGRLFWIISYFTIFLSIYFISKN